MNSAAYEQQLNEDIRQREYEIKRLGCEAESIGVLTLDTLIDQGEQIDRIHTHQLSICSTLAKTDRNLKRIKRFRQRFLDFFHRACICSLQEAHQSSFKQTRQSLHKMFEHLPTISQSTDLESDHFSGEFQPIVHRLRSLAVHLNNEIDRQNLKLYGDIRCADTLNTSIEQQTNTIQKMN